MRVSATQPVVSCSNHINTSCQVVNIRPGHWNLDVYLWGSKSCHPHCESCQCLSADGTGSRQNIPCEMCSSAHSPPPDGIVIIADVTNNRRNISRKSRQLKLYASMQQPVSRAHDHSSSMVFLYCQIVY